MKKYILTLVLSLILAGAYGQGKWVFEVKPTEGVQYEELKGVMCVRVFNNLEWPPDGKWFYRKTDFESIKDAIYSSFRNAFPKAEVTRDTTQANMLVYLRVNEFIGSLSPVHQKMRVLYEVVIKYNGREWKKSFTDSCAGSLTAKRKLCQKCFDIVNKMVFNYIAKVSDNEELSVFEETE